MRNHVLEASGGGHSDNRKRPADDRDASADPSNKAARTAELKDSRAVASPWWDVPYAEQLQRKQKAMRAECLVKLCREVQKTYKVQGVERNKIPAWLMLKGQWDARKLLNCP